MPALRALPLVLALLLGGCFGGMETTRSAVRPVDAAPTGVTAAEETGDPCRKEWMRKDDVHLSLIRQLVDEGALHAGMAHIESLPAELRHTLLAEYLKAEILRRTGNTRDAVVVYEALLGTCLGGAGHHGLGLIAARAGNLDAAIRHLTEAKEELPTHGKIRNDLGYALYLKGDYSAARNEFLTAIELGDYRERAARNLVMMLYQQGQDAEAERYARRYEIPDEIRKRLRLKAQSGTPAPGTGGGQGGVDDGLTS